MHVTTMIEEITRELWWFEWRSPVFGSVCGGDIRVEGTKLLMTVYALDNDDDGEEREVNPLRVATDVDTTLGAREQIRRLIHAFLCHEADEQLYFGETPERPFYPQHPTDNREMNP